MVDNDKLKISLIEQIQPINYDLSITLTPENVVLRYEYQIIKDKKIYREIKINDKNPTTVLLDSTGKFQIIVKTYDKFNKSEVITTGLYNIDKEKPIILLDSQNLDMPLGAVIDVMGDVRAYDNQDGDLFNKVKTNFDSLDFTTVGIKELVYTVTDSAGNVGTNTVYINVYKSNMQSVLLLQNLSILFIVIVAILIAQYRKGIKLERRITKYSIEPIEDDRLSVFDKLINYYKKLMIKISKVLSTSVFITKHSEKYEKYLGITDEIHEQGLDYISSKIVISLLFLSVAFIAKLIQYELINTYRLILPITLGFFIPNLIYIFRYRNYRSELENDFLQAITVMNNAFKSGRSIVQAIELVTRELAGPIAKEFEKMMLEINFGLSIDVVFKRFADRVQLEEVTYLTVSLTILNKTGGNIIKVFSSIEKTLFNKKKLALELKSLTGSSKIVVIMLLVLPILFLLVINLINPGYFVPLYTTPLGGLISFMILILYTVYIYIVQAIIKVRM